MPDIRPWLARLPAVILVIVGALPYWLRLLDWLDKSATVMDTLHWLDHPFWGIVLILGGLLYWALIDRPAPEARRILTLRDDDVSERPSRLTAAIVVSVIALVIALGLWFFLRDSTIPETLNVRIEMPASIGWPKRPEAFPPGLNQFFEFVTSAINLSSTSPVILDFGMTFKFDGAQISLYGTPLTKNMFMLTPDVINRDTRTKINGQGLRIEPLQQVQIAVIAQLPSSVEPDVHHEALLVVEDRISMKRVALPVMRWTNDEFARNMLRHGMRFHPLIPTPNQGTTK